MKLGPVHVVTHETMSAMVAALDRLGREITQLQQNRETASEQLGEFRQRLADLEARAVPLYHLFTPVGVRLAPTFADEPDADTPAVRGFVQRVLRAYQRASQEFASPGRCLWESMAEKNRDFLHALETQNEDAAFAHFRRMFQTDLVWGLGLGTGVEWLPVGRRLAGLATDQLRGLAEAIGVLGVTNQEQRADEWATPLDLDVDALFSDVQSACDFELAVPTVGGNGGVLMAGQRVHPDLLTQAYSVVRLRELGLTSNEPLIEIGGGYGALALLAFRAGVRDITIYDLPWVLAIQGYFLLQAGCPVQLFGESNPGAAIQLLPGDCLTQREDRSAGWAVNTNSLPEMAESTARGYLRELRRVTRCGLLSINQEARAAVLDYGPQGRVADLARGLWQRQSRHRHWMRHGYVEEVYR